MLSCIKYAFKAPWGSPKPNFQTIAPLRLCPGGFSSTLSKAAQQATEGGFAQSLPGLAFLLLVGLPGASHGFDLHCTAAERNATAAFPLSWALDCPPLPQASGT